MSWILISYYLYLIVSIVVVVKVGLVLYQNGYFFLYHAFGQPEIANAINKLLLLGYLLTNIAVVLFFMQAGQELSQWSDLIELLAWKLGVVVGSLGIMHHFNIIAIAFASRYFLKEKKNHL